MENERIKEILNSYGENELNEIEKIYCEKYLVSAENEIKTFLNLKQKVFNDTEYPKALFKCKFKIIFNKGGLLLYKKQFEDLLNVFTVARDTAFYAAEYDIYGDTPLIFKYPTSITWAELNTGDRISFEIYQRPIKRYLLLGDSGLWGKYIDNDLEKPLEIIGFSEGVKYNLIAKFKCENLDSSYFAIPEDFKKAYDIL